MKKLRRILTIMFLSFLLFGMSSCLIRVHDDEYGRHKVRHHRDNDRPVLIITGGDHERHSGDNDRDND